MERWLALLYPAALGYLAWLLAQMGAGEKPPRPRLAQVAIFITGFVLTWTSILIGIFGPVWLLMTFAGWPLEGASVPGTLLGLLVVFSMVGWTLSGIGQNGVRVPARERLKETAELVGSCGIPVLFVLGQVLTLGLGGAVGYGLALWVLRFVTFPAWVEDGICQVSMGVFGILTMCGAVLLASIWTNPRHPAAAELSHAEHPRRRRSRR